jgi:hypothetical protein
MHQYSAVHFAIVLMILALGIGGASANEPPPKRGKKPTELPKK